MRGELPLIYFSARSVGLEDRAGEMPFMQNNFVGCYLLIDKNL